MPVKKTGSPFASGAEANEQIASKDALSRIEKTDGGFEAVLSDAASSLDQASGTDETQTKLRSEFQRIAGKTNFDSPEGEAAAIQESAQVLINSRLGKDFEKTQQGKKVSEKLSSYIVHDPFLQKKLRDILHKFR